MDLNDSNLKLIFLQLEVLQHQKETERERIFLS